MQRRLDALVGDLEVAAAGELLELDQREIGLDAGGVAIHQQPDGAGRGEQGGLGVAIAVELAARRGRDPRPRCAACDQLAGARAPDRSPSA